MEQELKIKINGDIDGLKKAVEESSKELDTLTSAQSRVNNQLKALNQTALQYEKSLNTLNENYRKGGISQQQYARESEKLQRALGESRNEITAYQRESDRLAKQITRASAAQSRAAQSTAQDTRSTQANSAATRGNTVEVQKNESALIRHVYAQRAALSASNNLARSFASLTVGGRGAATSVGVMVRQLASLSTVGMGASGGMASLASSFVGPGGIVIAISAAASLLTSYIATKMSAKRATDDASSANKNYIDTLDGVARAQVDGEQAANRDLTNLRLLYEATQNLTLPMEARRKAAEELIRQYPRQFEGMTTEAVLAGRAASAYNQLTASITATAMAAANLDRVRENSNKILENRLEIIDKMNKVEELNAKIRRQEALTPLPGRGTGQAGEAMDNAAATRLNKMYSERQRLLDDINKIGQEAGKLTEQNIQLQEEYNKQIMKGADLSGSITTNLERSGKATKEATDRFASELLRGENRLRIAVKAGRDKELEEATIRYESLLALAGENAEKRLQVEDLYRRDLEAINAKWDEQERQAAIKGEEQLQSRREAIARKGWENLKKIRERDSNERIKEEERLLRELERQNRRYARMLSSELSRAFEGFLSRGENVFKALGDAFKRMIVRMVAEAAALKVMNWVTGSGGGGGSGANWGAWIRTAINIASRFIGSGGGGSAYNQSPMSGARLSATASGGAFSPSSNSPVIIADVRLRGQDQLVQFNRANRFNGRFNGGQ